MRKKVFLPLFGVCVFAGASLTFTQSNSPSHGVIVVPNSTREYPWDVGYRAHTNHLIMVRPEFNGASPAGETPGSLSCVYQITSGPSGCPISTSTAVASGGSGMTVLVDAFDYPSASSDFVTFSNQFGLPSGNNCGTGTQPCFTKVYAANHKPKPNCGWAQESALDIEWAHAMAPKAQIILVEAASNGLTDLLSGVDVATRIVQEGTTGEGEVSMSWGGTEFATESSFDSHFVHAGVIYVAASGDSGGVVIWPSASPLVVSAGGTKVNRNSSGSFTGESAWSGAGGGPSAFEAEPGYQSVVTTVSLSNMRGTPDFSFDADPNSGVSVYDSTVCQGFSGWLVFGGTSIAAPSLSGIVNLAHYSHPTSTEEHSIIYSTYASTSYLSDFRDVTTGSNGFPALVKWDFTTGIGSSLGLSGK